MKAKNKNYFNLSNILLSVSIIIIIVMSLYIYRLNNELSNLKSSYEQTNIISDSNKSNSPKNTELIGLWKTYQATDSETNEIITDLTQVFGSAYLSFGSTLKLNDDGTFLDSIYPITSNEVSVKGTFKIKRDLYEQGDCYIVLTYSDETEKKFAVTYENKVPILSSSDIDQDYQFDLRK